MFNPTSEVTVALSGTLDTFAIPDVLRLLSSTSKSGRLRITGDRGSGSVWVEDGEVVATELASAVSRNPSNAEVVFGLLRFSAGSFSFEVDSRAAHAGEPSPMEPILGEAENMLAEWKVIQGVIPNLDVWVGLTPRLTGPDVMIDGDRWQGIACIGSGAQVGAVAEGLGLSEIDSCRLVKELIELGLVQFVDEPAGIPTPMTFEPEPEPFEPIEIPGDREPGGVLVEPLDDVDDSSAADHEVIEAELDGSDVEADGEDDADELTPSSIGVVPSLASLEPRDEESVDPLLSAGDPLDGLGVGDPLDHLSAGVVDDGGDLFAEGGADADDEELNPAEMARQLANLSPRAAKAVAAAAKATTAEEREAALAAVEAEDDTVNRGLLLKFLGSVDS